MNKDYYKIECTLYEKIYPSKYRVLIKNLDYLNYYSVEYNSLKECRAFIRYQRFVNSLK